MSTTIKWFWFASPQTFFPLAGTLARWSGVLAALLAVAGLYVGFFVAPTDAQQGEVYRIIFIHVPAAWMSMFLYVVMAFWAAIGLAFNTRLSSMMASAIAPTGALFTFLALWTGALMGGAGEGSTCLAATIEGGGVAGRGGGPGGRATDMGRNRSTVRVSSRASAAPHSPSSSSSSASTCLASSAW